MFIDIWDKNNKKYTITNTQINYNIFQKILAPTICKKAGTTFTRGNIKYLIRSHTHTTQKETHNPYDPRIMSKWWEKIIPKLKETWLKI